MMKPRYFCMLLAAAGMAVGAFAQAHPDLSGVWSFTIDLPPTKLKVENGGKAEFKVIDRGLGAPRKIVQLPKETIFFYEDISGDPYRIIPTDGRAHRKNGNPTSSGDSLGR